MTEPTLPEQLRAAAYILGRLMQPSASDVCIKAARLIEGTNAPASQAKADDAGPGGKIEVDTDLARRCLEVLEWHRTGLLTDGALRSFAATHGLDAQYGDDLGVRKAEDITAQQAMAFIVRLASEKVA